jgi:hypothetical protein
MASLSPRGMSAEDLVRLLHRRRLQYRARIAHQVMLTEPSSVATDLIPGIAIVDPWGPQPALVVDGRTIPAQAWSQDQAGFRWAFEAGKAGSSGALTFQQGRALAGGSVTFGGRTFAVELTLEPARFRCALSRDAGAHVSTGTFQLVLHTPGVSWDTATWVDAGLELAYHVQPGSGFGDPSQVIVAFTDTGTGVGWTPDDQSSFMTRDLTLGYDAGGEVPPPDDRARLAGPAAGFPAIFPLQLIANLWPDAQQFEAAIAVDSARVPTVYAVRGTYLEPPAPLPAPPVADLPAVLASAAPDPNQLLGITPFQTITAPDGSTRTVDVVQQAATQDFYNILVNSMPDELLTFVAPVNPDNGKPVRRDLEADVAPIASLPGKDGATAADFYQSLAVPFLTQVLARSTAQPPDPFAATLNARRARDWMSRQTATSSVFNAQMPALYNMRFAQLVPAINPYVEDQKANAASYAAAVLQDATAWKQEIHQLLSSPSPANEKSFTDMVDELSQLGANGHYWAYRLFRHATAPSTLRALQNGSMAPGQGNMSFGVTMQGTCATLAMLDPSGTFTKRYARVIAMVQISNVFSQLIDYAGSGDALAYIVPRLVDAFLQRYGDSPDPDVQEAVAALEQAKKDQTIKDFIAAFVNASSEVSGAYEWRTLCAAYQEGVSQPGLMVADIVAAGCAVGGLTMFIMGVKDWKNLGTLGQANVAVGGIELFVNTSMSLVKRVTALTEILSSEGRRWETFRVAINPLYDNLTRAQSRVLSGLTKQIIGQTDREAAALSNYVPLAEAGEEVVDEGQQIARLTTAERWLGRNLDEFGVRLGVVFGVANLIRSAIELAESPDDLSRASNALFVAGSAIETITYAAGWFVQGALEVTEAVLETLSQVMSACTIVAAALAAVGLVLAIVERALGQSTPIETFARNDAAKEGFFMPLYYDVESFVPFTPPSQPSRVAVTLSGGTGNVLRLGTDKTATLAPADQTNPTSLRLISTGTSMVRIACTVPVPNTATLCLTLDGNKLVAAPYADDSTPDGVGAVGAQLWTVVPRIQPALVPAAGGGIAVNQGFITFQVATNPSLYLDLRGSAPALSAVPVAVLVTMTAVAAQGLTMADPLLSTADRDRWFMPNLITAGSGPRTFRLSPALPAGFSFDPKTGIISQNDGVAPPITPSTAYTLTCENGVAPAATVTFHLSVNPPPVAAAEARA